ncbi:MAG: ATP synthase F1 subunit gamma [Candidatus Sericytochromatia bacterium]|nr:ATP synthase F1 subunit gamma [Candidatus Tanganyikabacteria bacterium]
MNTRDIRRRIRSVENTKKITKAMEMVAAAKVRRAQSRVLSNRPYAEKLGEMFAHVTAHLPPGEVHHPLLAKREVRNVLLIVVTSDKGLCGGYNSNILRFAIERMRELKGEGLNVSFVIVGTKGVNFFRHSSFAVVGRMQGLSAVPTHLEAETLVHEALAHFESGEVDRVELLYTKFGGMTRFIPTRVDVLPASLEQLAGEGIVVTDHEVHGHAGPSASPQKVTRAESPYIFEPDAEAMIGRLIPAYLSNEVYQALLESAASFLASQMMAMGSATKSAGEMISHLTIVYNKARQAGITQEILEVVGGAEALKG